MFELFWCELCMIGGAADDSLRLSCTWIRLEYRSVELSRSFWTVETPVLGPEALPPAPMVSFSP